MDEAAKCFNTPRPLTTQLDLGERGLAMKATPCSVPGCDAPRHAYGMCQLHAARWRRRGDVNAGRPPAILTCTIEGCDRKHASKGLCSTHIARLKRTGTTDAPIRAIDRYAEDVLVAGDDECWPWTGRLSTEGYGMCGHAYAHRIACIAAHGEPKEGQVTLHSCDNPPCVNPAHLSWGTQGQNVLDSYRRGRR